MANINGLIYIDFKTDKSITTEQFKNFKRKVNQIVNDWEMMIYNAAHECGFEADSFHPIILDELAFDYNYRVISLIVENRHSNVDIHKLPESKL